MNRSLLEVKRTVPAQHALFARHSKTEFIYLPYKH